MTIKNKRIYKKDGEVKMVVNNVGEGHSDYFHGGQAALYCTAEAYIKLENEIVKLKKKNKKLKKKLKGHRYCERIRDNAYAPRHTGFKIENIGNITGSGGDGSSEDVRR